MKTRVIGMFAAALMLSAIPAVGRVAQAAVIVLEPTDDAHIASGQPNGNWGDELAMSQYGQSGHGTRPVLKFDLSSIPDGATVLAAELTLLFSGQYGSEATLLSRLPGDNWVEETVTWNSFDQSGAVDVAVVPKADDPPWPMTWSIAIADWDYVQDLTDNAVTLMLRFNNEGNGYYKSHQYSSKEGAVAPTLRIDYVPEPASLALLALGVSGMLIRRDRKGSQKRVSG